MGHLAPHRAARQVRSRLLALIQPLPPTQASGAKLAIACHGSPAPQGQGALNLCWGGGRHEVCAAQILRWPLSALGSSDSR